MTERRQHRRDPSPRRRRPYLLVGTFAAIVGVAAWRYASFDVAQYADDVSAQLSSIGPTTVSSLHAIAGAASPDSVVDAALSLEADGFPDRAERYLETMTALRGRYHSGPSPCGRYPASINPSPAAVDEATDAIIAAGLASELDEITLESSRWEQSEDTLAHKLDFPTEVYQYFVDRGTFWTRLGIWMHRDSVHGALQRRLRPNADVFEKVTGLSDDARAQITEIWTRYGPAIRQAVQRVARRKLHVELRAPRLRLVEPNMTEAQVRGLLGNPADDAGERWTYPDLAAVVAFGADRRVSAITCSFAEWRTQATVYVDGQPVVHLDEATVIGLLGQPAWARLVSQDPRSGREVVYDVGPHRLRLVFLERLERVELWRRDLLVGPQGDSQRDGDSRTR